MTTEKDPIKPGFWIGMLVVVILLFFTLQKCHGQCDTIPCKIECIGKTILQPTLKGTDKIYVVYHDSESCISDLIPVSKTVYEYMELCKKNNLVPSLGIRFKNGQITSIIRYKKRYKIKK